MRPQAIETEYAGCRFRSRIEARWAVFFDHLGIEWQYEAQGYELPSGRYLPDFWLPKILVGVADGHAGPSRGAFFEVKGPEPTRDEMWRCVELGVATGTPAFIAWGGHPDPSEVYYGRRPDGSSGIVRPFWARALGSDEDRRNDWAGFRYEFALEGLPCWQIQPCCGQVALGWPGKARCGCFTAALSDHQRLLDAHRAARSARFEFGESG